MGFSENCKWDSMIWNSSCGDGILPVDILDQIGISFNEISNAPEAINYEFTKIKILEKIFKNTELFKNLNRFG